MSYFSPFGFNPAAFGAGGFGPGFGFGGMGFGGFPAGFGYGGFPAGFGAMGGGFGGFGPGGVSSERGGGGGGGSGYDKVGYGVGGGYRSSTDRDSQSSKIQSTPNGASSSSTRGSASYDQSSLSGGYGYSPFGGMGGSMVASGDWSNFPAAAMMGMYGGYNAGTGSGAAASDSASKGYTTATGGATDSTFPMGNYSQMNSSFGPVVRSEGTARPLSGTDTKGSRGYRPY
jgi:hypothetical protein